MPMTLTAQLSELARAARAPADAHASPAPAPRGPTPCSQSPGDRERRDDAGPGPIVLADRPDGTVVGLGSVVAKAHPPDTEAGELGARLRAAAHPLLRHILLPPLPDDPSAEPPASVAARRLPGGRLATVWPRGSALDPDDEGAVPWEEAGTLLARLHAVPPAALSRLPPMRGPLKAARAMARMRAALAEQSVGEPRGLEATLRSAARAVERAWSALPAWCRAESPPPPHHAYGLCHGDFHLGQLIRLAGPAGPRGQDSQTSRPATSGGWRLIDVDDLGVGDPAWDLARPAAWFAAGLLPAQVWERFLHAYTSAGGWNDGDPWPWLDSPARALTAQSAALGIAKAYAANRPLDEAQQACVESCSRMAATAPKVRP
jgi:aminoglycoside phosphotransferase (APT) family kinase protein